MSRGDGRAISTPGVKLGPYCYFFSYARDDGRQDDGEEDPYFREFFRDLRKEVGDRTGLDPDEVCFYDKDEIAHGAHWPTRLATGLQKSRAFLYLLSRRYLQREYCVKEWAVFRTRVQGWKDVEAERMLPILWVGRKWVADRLPGELKYIQDSAGKYPAAYAQYGVKGLRRLRGAPGQETAYDQFIVALAEQVAEFENDPLPVMADQLPDITTLPASWSLVGPAGAAPPPPGVHPVPGAGVATAVPAPPAPAAPVATPRVALFAYLARTDPGAWRPFPAGVPGAEWLVRSLALGERVDYEAVRLDVDRAAVVRRAAEGHHPLVVLVDAAEIAGRVELLRDLITRARPGGALRGLIVLAVWSTKSDEAPAVPADAERAWSALVGVAAGSPDAVLDRIDSAEELTTKLSALLSATVIRVAAADPGPKRVEGSTVIEKPSILGPGSTAK